jgi:hypothetical protein
MPILWRLRQEDHKFETSLGYIVKGKKEGRNGGRKGGREGGKEWYVPL